MYILCTYYVHIIWIICWGQLTQCALPSAPWSLAHRAWGRHLCIEAVDGRRTGGKVDRWLFSASAVNWLGCHCTLASAKPKINQIVLSLNKTAIMRAPLLDSFNHYQNGKHPANTHSLIHWFWLQSPAHNSSLSIPIPAFLRSHTHKHTRTRSRILISTFCVSDQYICSMPTDHQGRFLTGVLSALWGRVPKPGLPSKRSFCSAIVRWCQLITHCTGCRGSTSKGVPVLMEFWGTPKALSFTKTMKERRLKRREPVKAAFKALKDPCWNDSWENCINLTELDCRSLVKWAWRTLQLFTMWEGAQAPTGGALATRLWAVFTLEAASLDDRQSCVDAYLNGMLVPVRFIKDGFLNLQVWTCHYYIANWFRQLLEMVKSSALSIQRIQSLSAKFLPCCLGYPQAMAGCERAGNMAVRSYLLILTIGLWSAFQLSGSPNWGRSYELMHNHTNKFLSLEVLQRIPNAHNCFQLLGFSGDSLV